MRLLTESDGERRVRFRYLVLLTALGLVGPAVAFVETGTVEWAWLVVGAAVFGVAAGPFTRTKVAERINRVSGKPGSLPRVLVVALMAIGVVVVVKLLDPDTVTANSFVGGGMAALLVVSAGRRLRS